MAKHRSFQSSFITKVVMLRFIGTGFVIVEIVRTVPVTKKTVGFRWAAFIVYITMCCNKSDYVKISYTAAID